MDIIQGLDRVEYQPIVVDGKVGYSYTVIEDWVIDGVETSDYTNWCLYSDGTFTFERLSDSERFIYFQEGTFDQSKYQEIVTQIENNQEEWMSELFYDESTVNATWG